ncbi:MAG: hypothetical protein Q7J73_07830 [Dehalococcoidales bacterium]|nr:hypothetical protein [Dehalococcoidales bacterium]
MNLYNNKFFRIVAVILIGGLLLTGSCTQASKAPKSVLIKLVLVDGGEEWSPSTVSVSAGGVVTWANTGNSFSHALISGEGLFNQVLSPGQSFNYTFTHNGTFTYHDDPYTPVGIGIIYVE